MSSAWDLYAKRLGVRGVTKREELYKREVRNLRTKLPESLSYKTLEVYEQDSTYNISTHTPKQQNMAVIDSDNLDEKYLYSMPEEDIENGAVIHWQDCYWIVTERDANVDVYTRAKMVQCNFLLRWIDRGQILEQWCLIEDGTKLKRTRIVRNSLAYWKRYVKTTPLIAGNPLELCKLQRSVETRRRECLKIAEIGQSAAEPRTGAGSTTNSVARVGTSVPKRGALNHIIVAW